jgi:ribonuclease R
VNLALLRSLKQARYSTSPVGHYGLAKKFYTHFTSPIRRYADLLVHRMLRAIVSQTSRGSDGPAATDPLPRSGEAASTQSEVPRRYAVQDLARTADHISRTERVADEAEKESVELKKIEFFQQQLMTGTLEPMPAVVSGVRNFGIFVELTETLVQGLVHISTLEDDFYCYDESRERLVGKKTKRIIQIGDKLSVQVERVDIFKRQIDFRMAES